MAIQHLSAITFTVKDMARSLAFYEKLGFKLIYGGEHSSFTSLRAGQGFVNLSLADNVPNTPWGRAIFRVDDVDSLYEQFKENGLRPDLPRNGEWGERYFHLKDPDGHELSFAELLSQSADDS